MTEFVSSPGGGVLLGLGVVAFWWAVSELAYRVRSARVRRWFLRVPSPASREHLSAWRERNRG